MRATCVVALAACIGTASAPALRAQAPAERARLDSLRAELTAVSDSTALLAREAARIEVARQNREDPLIHFELGLIAFRIGEITGADKHFEDAAGEFEWAAELRPDWPYPWYWLGQAELALGESRIIALENLRQILGTDALSKAARAFARAAQADPAFSRALVDLGNTALRQRIAARLDVAQQALRLAAGTPAGEDPEVLLVRGRVERELGANDSALAAFRTYVALGGDPSIGGLEMARSLFAVNRTDSAVAAYFVAASRPVGAIAHAEFRREVGWVATPEDLQEFDEAPRDSLGPWLRRFWGRRDVADARLPGERLVEAFRRYAYGRQHFRLVSRHRHYDISEVYRDTTQSEFDDRGIIYLRHGEPDARARYVDSVVHPNETWAYRRPATGDLIFHFVARDDVQDFKLVESVLDAVDFRLSLGLAGTGRVGYDPSALFLSRQHISPLYQQLALSGSAGTSRLLARERQEGQRSIRVGTTTDDFPLRFERDLQPVVSSFAVAAPGSGGELHVVFALPASRLQSFPVAAGGVAYPVRFRVVVFDSAHREVGGVDTLRIFRAAAPLPGGAFLTEQVVVPLSAGTHQYHFVVEELNASAGGLVAGQSVDVPAADRGFGASDLVLGRVGSGLVWRRPVGDVPLNPLLRFPRDGVLELFYELYGLPVRTPVVTNLGVRPRGGRSLFSALLGRRGGVQLQYTTETDAAGLARVRQQVNLGGLRPGWYDLEVELHEPLSGVRVVRRQSFEISGARAP